MPDDLKGSSTSTEKIDVDADQSVACKAASCTQKSQLQALDTSTAAIQSIAVTLATKEAREAKEDLKRGRLELL
jgi:hypothetical protein